MAKHKNIVIHVWKDGTESISELQEMGNKAIRVLELVFPQLNAHSMAIDGGRMVEFEVNGKYPKLNDVRLILWIMGYNCNVSRYSYEYDESEDL